MVNVRHDGDVAQIITVSHRSPLLRHERAAGLAAPRIRPEGHGSGPAPKCPDPGALRRPTTILCPDRRRTAWTAPRRPRRARPTRRPRQAPQRPAPPVRPSSGPRLPARQATRSARSAAHGRGRQVPLPPGHLEQARDAHQLLRPVAQRVTRPQRPPAPGRRVPPRPEPRPRDSGPASRRPRRQIAPASRPCPARRWRRRRSSRPGPVPMASRAPVAGANPGNGASAAAIPPTVRPAGSQQRRAADRGEDDQDQDADDQPAPTERLDAARRAAGPVGRPLTTPGGRRLAADDAHRAVPGRSGPAAPRWPDRPSG